MNAGAAVWWRLVPLLPLLVAVPVAEFLARAMHGVGPLWAIEHDSFTQVAVASIVVVFCLTLTDRRMALLAGGGGVLAFAILSSVLAVLELPRDTANFLWLMPFGAVGLAGFVVAIARARGAARQRWAERLATALVVPLLCLAAPLGLWLTSRQSVVYDLHILAFEDTLGVRFATVSMRAGDALPALKLASALAYFAIALGFGLLRIMQVERAARVDAMRAFVAAAAVGFVLYFLFPAIGPTHTLAGAFGGAWPAVGAVVPEPFVGAANFARNAMPSLHTAWALLIIFNSGSLADWPRVGFRVFAALNILATMLLGEHWITDLVVAVPFAVAIQALCTPSDARSRAPRRHAIAAGVVLVAAWLVGLRWFIAGVEAMPPALSWLALALTVVVPLLLERRLRLGATRRNVRTQPVQPATVPTTA